ncbi:hypothetical protein [Sphingobacterium multivorum]|uniref:Uncharacterized protein n=1 Tax=Sphingobacterium multivorum TaxID=28454 RepID=A0A653YQJ8_SPHMU|nr:hypothetical protein [Sphingobacterium multivorum]VXC44134.1 conserved hypothetical protein [Sphingobacterium multivorum]
MAAPFAVITDNGVVLDVAQDSKLTVKFVSSAFNEDTVMKGSFSYPVVFPFTEKNDAAFSYGRFLENRLGRKTIDVNLSFLGMSWKRGRVEYDVSSKGYDAFIVVDNSLVADLMRDVTVPQVFTETKNGKFVSHKSIRIDASGASVNDRILTINNSVGGYPFCMPTYINPMATGELEVVDDGSGSVDFEKSVINDFSDGYVVQESSLYGAFFYWTWIIKEVCSFLGFKAVGSYLDDHFVKSIIIDNTGVRQGSDILASGTINPAQHLPTLSIADFIKALRNDHKVIVYFDSQNQIAHFEKSTKVLSQPNRMDISDAQIKNSMTIKRQPTGAYKLMTKTDDADEMYKVLPYEGSVIIGYTDTFKEAPMTIGRPFMWAFNLWGIENVRLPRKTQTGNCYGDPLNGKSAYNADNEYGKNSFALRLLSYKGSFGLGGTVHIAESTSDDIGNQDRTFDNSLMLGGDKGIINKFTLPWYSFYCISEQVELQAKLNINQFMAINPLQKLFISGENRAKVELLMDEVTFEPSRNNETVFAKIVGYPHYDLNAIASGFRVVVNSPETIQPEGKLYAKVFMEIKPGNNQYRTYADLVIEFYQDSQTSIHALSVNNMHVHIDRQVRNFDDGTTREEGPYGDDVVSSNRVILRSNVDRYWYRYGGKDALMYYYVSDSSPLHDKFEVVGQWIKQLDGTYVAY